MYFSSVRFTRLHSALHSSSWGAETKGEEGEKGEEGGGNVTRPSILVPWGELCQQWNLWVFNVSSIYTLNSLCSYHGDYRRKPFIRSILILTIHQNFQSNLEKTQSPSPLLRRREWREKTPTAVSYHHQIRQGNLREGVWRQGGGVMWFSVMILTLRLIWSMNLRCSF